MNDFVRRLLYLPEQASTVSMEIDQLHYFVIGITMLGATVVAVVAVWWSVKYRATAENVTTQRVQATLLVEGLVLSGLVVLFVVFWVIGYSQYLRLRVPPKDSMVVYVTAKQWMWKFSYPEGQQAIGTLVVPANRNVHLVMTSRDVIHSFYVPAFRIKQDVLPGRYYSMWFNAIHPGTYRIFCAEFCGLSHSDMWGDVVALRQEDFNLWLEGVPLDDLLEIPPGIARRRVSTGLQPTISEYPRGIGELSFPKSMAERGRDVAAKKGCLSCHTLDGQPHLGPTWRGLWNKEVQLTTGETVIADEAYLTRAMMDPLIEVSAGYGPIMPTYQGLLEPFEVGALLELIRSLDDNLPDPIRYPEPLLHGPSTSPLDFVDQERALENLRETTRPSPP